MDPSVYSCADHGLDPKMTCFFGCPQLRKRAISVVPTLISVQNFNESRVFQEFQELATSHSSFLRAGNRRWFTNVEDGTASVEGWFTIEGDVEIASALFRLVKTNDTWKIVAYRIQDEVGGFAGGTIPLE